MCVKTLIIPSTQQAEARLIVKAGRQRNVGGRRIEIIADACVGSAPLCAKTVQCLP